MTVDDRVVKALYNSYELPITGNLNNWSEEKNISFHSCDVTNPGKLKIEGLDYNSKDHCTWGGLLLHCTASDQTNPWHNFKTDDDHWKDKKGEKPCVSDAGMMSHFAEQDMPNFMKKLKNLGAKKIWAERKEVTLTGSPFPAGKNCSVEKTCSCNSGYEGAKCDYCKNGYSKGRVITFKSLFFCF